jgi:hypothetical protein
MTNGHFKVLDPSEQQIQDYWKWLLSVNPDDKDNNPKDGVFYTRAALNYTHAIHDQSHPMRVNLYGSKPNSVGTQHAPVALRSNVSVFIPILDTLVIDRYLNPSGNPLTTSEMNNVLHNENRQISPGDLNTTIEMLEDGAGPVSIVPRINNILYSPSAPNDTFELKIPKGSTLADKMEFILREDTTVKAKVAGLYLLLDKISPGRYHITNGSSGVRGYRSSMDYYIQIK